VVQIHPPPLQEKKRYAGIAQLVERQPSKLNVEGSNPFSRSSPQGYVERKIALLAQSVERVLGKDEVSSSILEEGSSILTEVKSAEDRFQVRTGNHGR
jgi:hypothetical protein